MLNEKGIQNLYNQIWKLWIEPEIQRRTQYGSLPEDFKISRCLIRLPKDKPPIVEFNDEISWIALVKKTPTSIKKGDPIYIHEIQEIKDVSPPEVNGERVAFIRLLWARDGCHIAFDFTPNIPNNMISKQERDDWRLGKTIAHSLEAILTEKVIHIYINAQNLLQTIGLWPAPALLPYPLSKIINLLEEDDLDGAKSILLEHCNSEYIEKLSSKWWDIEQFNTRKKLILEALDCHKEGKYTSSIHVLLPHIEGIITDWIYTKISKDEVIWRQVSKTRKFHDLILEKPPSTFTYEQIVNSAVDFIVSGPVLKTFKRWHDQIDQAFPNRNVVEHGKYDKSLYTEENSIKLFLLIDTVYYIISSHLETGSSFLGFYFFQTTE